MNGAIPSSVAALNRTNFGRSLAGDASELFYLQRTAVKFTNGHLSTASSSRDLARAQARIS